MGSGPPGSAGVPPACTPVGCRSVSLRRGTRPPCRRERHGLGRSNALAPLPVEPGGGDDRGCAKSCAGGTPALPGGLPPMTSSHPRSSICICVHSCPFVVRLQQPSAVSSSNDLPDSAGVVLVGSKSTSHGSSHRRQPRRCASDSGNRRDTEAALGGVRTRQAGWNPYDLLPSRRARSDLFADRLCESGSGRPECGG